MRTHNDTRFTAAAGLWNVQQVSLAEPDPIALSRTFGTHARRLTADIPELLGGGYRAQGQQHWLLMTTSLVA